MYLEGSTILALERATDQVSHKGIKRLTRSSNWCTIFGSKNNPKKTCREERDLKPDEIGHVFMSHVALRCRSGKVEKTGVVAAFRLWRQNGMVSPKYRGQLFNTKSTDW